MTTEWKEFLTLRKIDRDISDGRFSRKYAASRQFLDRFRVSSCSPANVGKHLKRDSDEESGLISEDEILDLWLTESDEDILCFDNPYEVMQKDGKIFYREPDTKNRDREPPEFFDTQFGRFENYNQGEFGGHAQIGKHKFSGNFVDMFDFGDYVYAISALAHLCSGNFRLEKIDKHLHAECLFESRTFFLYLLLPEKYTENLYYIGRSMDSNHVKIYLTGMAHPMEGDDWDESKILQIGVDGSFSVIGDYKYAFGDASTVVDAGDLLYVGTNYMVTVVHLMTGEKEYYTSKTQEDIDEMMRHRYSWEK